jgi:hypothetical protein
VLAKASASNYDTEWVAAGGGSSSPVALKAYRNSALTPSLNADLKLDLDATVYDTGAYFAAGRFTPLVAGYYAVSGHVTVSTNVFGWAAIYKNGAAELEGGTVNVARAAFSANGIVHMNGTTDYLELWYRVGNSCSVTTGPTKTRLDVCRLG